MIQPYFKPDVNPSMPAFAVFYNGYFQERSKMNMQIMNLMLQQASPQYLTSMIEKTQGNIAELQKTREKILSADLKNKSNIAIKQATMDFEAIKIAGKAEQYGANEVRDLVFGGSRGGSQDKTADKQRKAKLKHTSKKNDIKSKLTDKSVELSEAYINKTFTDPVDQAMALYLIDHDSAVQDKINEVGQDPSKLKRSIKTEMETLLSTYEPSADYNKVLEEEFPDYYSMSLQQSEQSEQSPKGTRLEELGFTLTPDEQKFADDLIDDTGKTLQIKDGVDYYGLDSLEREIVDKRLRQRIATQTKGYVRAPTIPVDDTDFQSKLDYINKQLEEESKKLEGYLTRYDVGQQDVLEKMFAPFDSNYRTQNLFVRKSPEVLEQEKQIREMQYKDKTDTPSGYEKIKYNTEYQAPGGLNFGITKVGTEEIPYIFEGGTPYEIPQSDPSHSFILELLKEQDRKLGGIK